jgi:hypothetical protein
MSPQPPSLLCRRLIASLLYGVTALAAVAIGATYLFRTSFMPYHSAALGKSWSELDAASQVLIKGLMEVAAGGEIALGLLVLVLIYFPIRREERWARFTTPMALLLFYVPALLATLSVDQGTPASSPWQPLAIACGLVTVGFFVDTPWSGAPGRPPSSGAPPNP